MTADWTPGLTSGAEVAMAIRRAATERGQSLYEFARPLSPHPGSWVNQLEKQDLPRPHTIDRVRALLEGRPVPPPPPNNFHLGPGTGGRTPQRAQTPAQPARVRRRQPRPLLQMRDPCRYRVLAPESAAMNAPFKPPAGTALDPDLVELVKALARANAARDIARLRETKDSPHGDCSRPIGPYAN